MSLKELANKLQTQIDTKMSEFTTLGKKAKELNIKMDKIHLEMGNILKELEPVDSMIRHQNPEMCELFDSLVKLIKDTNGI